MRAASLFTIVYLVSQNLRSERIVTLLAYTLVSSSMLSVVLTAGQLIVGKGVKVEGVKSESPLSKAMFRAPKDLDPTPVVSGDIIWQVDGQRVGTPEEIANALAAGSPTARIRIYRVEWMPELEVPRGALLGGTNSLDQLGITSWSRGRDWRATGFYGHWVTYAEVLQLIASLALGLYLSVARKNSVPGWLLLLSVAGLVFALGMTVTRASWIGFAASVFLMVVLSSSKRTLIIVGACALPLVLASVVLLQQKRNIGFLDRKDQSTTWRETVWKEGFQLLIGNPRHMLVGVGMDSIKKHWRQWGMFDQGRLPIGHMHSNILQIALERGIPALIIWLILIGVYARLLFQLFRRSLSSQIRGLSLGALGGLAGFFVSGLVHYNWGDSEVAIVFYFIMGLSLVAERLVRRETQEPRA